MLAPSNAITELWPHETAWVDSIGATLPRDDRCVPVARTAATSSVPDVLFVQTPPQNATCCGFGRLQVPHAHAGARWPLHVVSSVDTRVLSDDLHVQTVGTGTTVWLPTTTPMNGQPARYTIRVVRGDVSLTIELPVAPVRQGPASLTGGKLSMSYRRLARWSTDLCPIVPQPPTSPYNGMLPELSLPQLCGWSRPSALAVYARQGQQDTADGESGAGLLWPNAHTCASAATSGGQV